MHKNASLLLNVFLTIAVIILYYFHFSSGSSSVSPVITTVADSATTKPVVLLPREVKASKIVYINTDVLNEKYLFVKELSDVAKANLQALESAYKKKANDFQERYAEFQQKASQGLLSENQTKDAQQELGKRKEELDQMEAKQQQMMEQMQRDNEKVLKTVMDYIKEYNKSTQYNYVLAYSNNAMSPVLVANDSLDITNEIVEGLNAQYKIKKGK